MEPREMWKFKKSQIQPKYQNFETVFQIFAYEDFWQILTPNLTPLFRHNLLSDGLPVTDKVVSF
jgi:hypothetical protein